LQAAYEIWKSDPTGKEQTLYLVDQYHQYVTSNVLTEASQRIYLLRTRDLCFKYSRGSIMASYWYKLAQMHLLGEDQLALQDVLLTMPDLALDSTLPINYV